MRQTQGGIAVDIFLWLFFILLGIWIVGWLVFHAIVGLFKILPVIALVLLIVYLVKRWNPGR